MKLLEWFKNNALIQLILNCSNQRKLSIGLAIIAIILCGIVRDWCCLVLWVLVLFQHIELASCHEFIELLLKENTDILITNRMLQEGLNKESENVKD